MLQRCRLPIKLRFLRKISAKRFACCDTTKCQRRTFSMPRPRPSSLLDTLILATDPLSFLPSPLSSFQPIFCSILNPNLLLSSFHAWFFVSWRTRSSMAPQMLWQLWIMENVWQRPKKSADKQMWIRGVSDWLVLVCGMVCCESGHKGDTRTSVRSFTRSPLLDSPTASLLARSGGQDHTSWLRVLG